MLLAQLLGRADGGSHRAKNAPPVTLLFWLKHFEAPKIIMLFWLPSAIFQALCNLPSNRPRLQKSRSHRNNAEFKAQVAVDCLNIGSLHC